MDTTAQTTASPAARVVDAEAEVVRAARAFVYREPSVCEAFVALARAVRLLEDARARDERTQSDG